MFQGNFKKDKKEGIIFFSLKNPFILIHKEGRGILITSDKIEKPFFYKSTLYKIFKKRKIKIEKVILIGNKFPENFIFISKYCKKIYLPNYTITPYVNSYKNIKKYNQENDEIILDNFVFSFKNGNLIIKYNDFKFLIILNENFEESLVKDKYFFIYPIVFKKNKKNEVIINGLKPYFYILQKDIKKFENLKGLCQNYFLNISSVILDLETGLIDYWRENDKGKY